MSKPKIKVIELSDTYTDNKYEFPYCQSINSRVRFLLRSKIVFDHDPVILIQNDRTHHSLFPLKDDFQLDQDWCVDNFTILKGEIQEDGGWTAELQCQHPGLVSFQLAFVDRKSQQVTRFGSCDTINVTQNKIDVKFLRKQSVFPRCIGHHSKWVDFFKKQMELGYNSFHLAPIQETGISKSYYSIYDQLELSSDVFEGTAEEKNGQLKTIITEMNSLGATFFVDIVLNHTSFDSEWIKSNPNSIYTTKNTPMLTSAFQIDQAIYLWGNQIKEVLGVNNDAMTEQEFHGHRQRLWGLITGLKIEDFFQVSEAVIAKFQEIVVPRKPSENLFAKDPIEAIQQFIAENASGVGSNRKGVQLLNLDTKWRTLNLAYEVDDLKKGIQSYNKKWRSKIQNEWIPEIINNVMGEIRWNYLQNHNRNYRDPYPFVNKYFTEIVSPKGENFYAINNGWVAGMETNVNFIYSEEFYYLRRRVQVWGDLVRIRYGQNLEDAPYSWRHMTEYVRTMAENFNGFRMDNLHGTQRHVAKYMIQQARKSNPNLIVFAELFTDTDQEKAMFVREVGINSTLKEGQHMLSGDSFMQTFHSIVGEGGPYIGSLSPYFQNDKEIIKYSKRKRPIILVYDLTHDNESYVKKGDMLKQLPIAMLTSFSGTFIGSTKGFDQFYSRHILVTEQAAIYSQDKHSPPVTDNSGITKKRIIYNDGKKNCEVHGSWDAWKEGTVMNFDEKNKVCWLDLELGPGRYQYKFQFEGKWLTQPGRGLNGNSNHEFVIQQGFQKTVYSNLEGFRKIQSHKAERFRCYNKYYAYNDKDVVVLVRETNDHEKAICIIANLSTQQQALSNPISLPGLMQNADIWYQTDYAVTKGISTEVEIVNHNNIGEFFEISHQGDKDVLKGAVLPAGFSCMIECVKSNQKLQAIRSAQEMLKQPIKLPPMGALDYNLLLFGIARQQEVRFGESNYVLPNNQQLLYAGFGGIIKMVKDAKRYNTLSSNLFDNVRQGRWLMHYFIRRVKKFKNLSEVADIMERYFSVLEELPHELIPRYFTDFAINFWNKIEYNMCNSTNQFQRQLSLATNQFISHFPNEKLNFQTTVSAGLPHFATGWARSWGRDTFISNELLLLHPNIYRDVILQYASALRHGLIPNLLDSGNNPRYNCRDACWWFIRGAKEYARHTGDYDIFKNKVEMLFLSNDLLEHNRRKHEGQKKIMLLQDIIQEIFQSHADGISYREWHAGYQIDSNMNSEGFTIHLEANQETGFIVGGNPFNCLTWMDKMGSSVKAGTKGLPATPRAGAPVEMVAILKHCLSAYHELHKEGKYGYSSVSFKKRQITFEDWAQIIQSHFEERFYVPLESENVHVHHSIQEKYIRLRGIYKDVVDAPLVQEEYRLRCNVLVAMSLAPQLFKKEHALTYLNNVKTHLLYERSIGVATLAPFHESLYSSYYDNDDNSDIIRLSHGYSYHNGPEWVWPYGFYITALIKMDGDNLKKKQVMALLQEHVKAIQSDQWCGLAELTNKNGDYNHFSCRTQAWSISSLLMAVQHIKKMPQ